MVGSEHIDRAAEGDLDALAHLDALGLLLGADEEAEAYVERLRALERNIAGMDMDLAARGCFEVEGVTVRGDRRIPPALFGEADAVTEALYGFRIDWVPGFFINPRFSLLFGGCAFYFYPDFFALFIIRKAFERRQRWLIYDRRELLAHELCHVARIGLGSRLFEETFAYRTSPSRFRRAAGSALRSPADTFAFLGCTLLLLVAQVARTLFLPALPIYPFWGLIGLVTVFLGLRHARLRRTFQRALDRAAQLAPDAAPAVLFRATDEEILDLAATPGPQDAAEWFAERCGESLRWQVIRHRFREWQPPSQAPAPADAVAPGQEPVPGFDHSLHPGGDAPERGDLGQGNQDKEPFGQPRVGDHESREGQAGTPHEQHVDVQDPPLPGAVQGGSPQQALGPQAQGEEIRT